MPFFKDTFTTYVSFPSMAVHNIDQQIDQYGGNSQGHWEGDTLVVEKTNFGDRGFLFASGGGGPLGGVNWELTEALHVVERFMRINPNTFDYEFTVDDPNIWTRPWTGSSPWARSAGPMFEYACHEGNYGMTNILAGARAEEQEAALRRLGNLTGK